MSEKGRDPGLENEAAIHRLARAVERLEQSACEALVSVETQSDSKGDDFRAEAMELQQTSDIIATRLDIAILKLRSVLDT